MDLVEIQRRVWDVEFELGGLFGFFVIELNGLLAFFVNIDPRVFQERTGPFETSFFLDAVEFFMVSVYLVIFEVAQSLGIVFF